MPLAMRRTEQSLVLASQLLIVAFVVLGTQALLLRPASAQEQEDDGGGAAGAIEALGGLIDVDDPSPEDQEPEPEQEEEPELDQEEAQQADDAIRTIVQLLTANPSTGNLREIIDLLYGLDEEVQAQVLEALVSRGHLDRLLDGVRKKTTEGPAGPRLMADLGSILDAHAEIVGGKKRTNEADGLIDAGMLAAGATRGSDVVSGKKRMSEADGLIDAGMLAAGSGPDRQTALDTALQEGRESLDRLRKDDENDESSANDQLLEAGRKAIELDGGSTFLAQINDHPSLRAQLNAVDVTRELELYEQQWERAGQLLSANKEKKWPPQKPADVAQVLSGLYDGGKRAAADDSAGTSTDDREQLKRALRARATQLIAEGEPYLTARPTSEVAREREREELDALVRKLEKATFPATPRR